MKIIKNKDHVLIVNEKGTEYHLSYEEYTRLGERKALEFAEFEMLKKESMGNDENFINFTIARRYGFCEYGIMDFCKELNLDVNKTYSLEYLMSSLTKKVILKYPNECQKLFKDKMFDNFGGIVQFIKDNKSEEVFNLIIKTDLISERNLRLLSCEIALSTLHHFEEKYPDDTRPRNAVEARLLHLEGLIGDEELNIAASAASAAYAASAAGASFAAYTAAATSAAAVTYAVAYDGAYTAAAFSYAAAVHAAHAAAVTYAVAYDAAYTATYTAAATTAAAVTSATYTDYCDILIDIVENDRYEHYELFLKKVKL